MAGHPMMLVCETLAIVRRTAFYVAHARPGGRYHRADDAQMILQHVRAVTNSRATHGYRRVWAMVNRTFWVRYNRGDAEPRDAEIVFDQLGGWFEDYNT